MKNCIFYWCGLLITFCLISGCVGNQGNVKDSQAVKDSIVKARQDSVNTAIAKAKEDSIEKVRQDSIEQAKKEEKNIEFVTDFFRRYMKNGNVDGNVVDKYCSNKLRKKWHYEMSERERSMNEAVEMQKRGEEAPALGADHDAILDEYYGGGVGCFESYKNLSVKSLGDEKYEVSFIGNNGLASVQKTIVLKLSEESGMTKISEIISTKTK